MYNLELTMQIEHKLWTWCKSTIQPAYKGPHAASQILIAWFISCLRYILNGVVQVIFNKINW